jgi:hypothetical protein
VGAKAGIGAGVGGSVLVVALIVVTALLCRKRRSKARPAQLQQGQYSYPIGAPMPASPYFSQTEKTSWNAGAYSAGSSPPMMSPQFDPAFHGDPAFQGQWPNIIPSLYSEQRSQKPPSVSPPTELSADQHVHELHSEQAITNTEAESVSDGKK